MDTMTKPLETLVGELTPPLRAEVRDFVEFLLVKRRRTAPRRLRQDWAGTLQAFRQQYTSVALQHLALEWRGG
ncbi:MAG: DUF2281 domain-containing protein [Chloroflexi bacterium]|nr:DUF2281 domain-containing protein [Chloroflexota bacterium]